MLVSIAICLARFPYRSWRPIMSCRHATILSCPALRILINHIRYQAVDGSFQWLSLERFEEFFQVERVARGNGGHRNLVRGRWLCVLRAVIEGPMLGGMSFLVL